MMQMLKRVPLVKVFVIPGERETTEPPDTYQALSSLGIWNPNVQYDAHIFTDTPVASTDIDLQISAWVSTWAGGFVEYALGTRSQQPGEEAFQDAIWQDAGLEGPGRPCDRGPAIVNLTIPKYLWNAYVETYGEVTVWTWTAADEFASPRLCTPSKVAVRVSYGYGAVDRGFVPTPGPTYTYWRSRGKVRDGNGEMSYIWGQRKYDPVRGGFVVETVSEPIGRVTWSGRGFGDDGVTQSTTLLERRPRLVRFDSVGPCDQQ